MSETLTTATTEAEIPDYPMARNECCPFAPPPDVMALAEERPLSRVRIWDGSTPWLITGYEQVRELFSDSRVSVDDRVPGFPHWNEGMLSTVQMKYRACGGTIFSSPVISATARAPLSLTTRS